MNFLYSFIYCYQVLLLVCQGALFVTLKIVIILSVALWGAPHRRDPIMQESSIILGMESGDNDREERCLSDLYLISCFFSRESC